jgi:LysM repeat protein
MRLIITLLILIITPHLFAQTSDSFYTVVKGDNIDSIAKKLGVSRDTIIELNPEIDPTKLRLGAKIKTSEAVDNFNIVVKGDTIESIETKTGVPRDTIFKLNYGINPNALKVGSKIKTNVAIDNFNIVEKGDTIPQAITPKRSSNLKRFATFEDYDNYRIAVCKDYLAAYNVIKNKLTNATPAEIKTYKDNAEKLIELQKCSKAYLRYNTTPTKLKSSTIKEDLKSAETFRKEQFQKIYSQISLIEITSDLQTPVTLEQIKSGADFVDKLKDLIALKPKFYVRTVTY